MAASPSGSTIRTHLNVVQHADDDHYSYSRLNRFGTCPLSFKLHYIDKLPAEQAIAPQFGTVLHRTLENVVRVHVRDNRVGPLRLDEAIRIYRGEWAASDLTDTAMFADGLAIVKKWVTRQGEVDYRNVLGIEQEFDLRIGPHRIIGAIDRVDRIDDETIRVRDYKSNRVLFTQEEIDHNLQLSIYDLAARQLWPWAKNVELELDMIRHGIVHRTKRTEEERETTREYVLATVAQIEAATDFPARLNAFCATCDHRKQCSAYTQALTGHTGVIACEGDSLEVVAKAREEAARIAKILTARKEELEKAIRAELQHTDTLQLAGMQYSMGMTTRTEYPFVTTADAIAHATGLPREHVLERLGATSKEALDSLLDEVTASMPKPAATLLRAQIAARAVRSHSPRFVAKEVRS